MRWFSLLGLALLALTRAPVRQDSIYLRIKTAYCYSRYSAASENVAATVDVRARAKTNADSLFPRYQHALEESRGTLTETLLATEVAKARTAASRLSAAEFFMTQEACDSLVASGRSRVQ